jgi:large subunit ribosomal protein L46
MNTWFVGRHPVGHLVSDLNPHDKDSIQKSTSGNPEKSEQKKGSEVVEFAGEKTFFMKARIFAGQADVKSANGNYVDFRWLSKDEIEKLVHQRYWSRVKDMLMEE